jgi:hypothetical protein
MERWSTVDGRKVAKWRRNNDYISHTSVRLPIQVLLYKGTRVILVPPPRSLQFRLVFEMADEIREKTGLGLLPAAPLSRQFHPYG